MRKEGETADDAAIDEFGLRSSVCLNEEGGEGDRRLQPMMAHPKGD